MVMAMPTIARTKYSESKFLPVSIVLIALYGKWELHPLLSLPQ